MRGFLATAALLCLFGCDLEEQVVAPGQIRMSVHSVLNPDASAFFVLVEEVRVGQPSSGSGPLSQSGIPVTDARVVIHGPGGDSAVGIHDVEHQNEDGHYYFVNRGSGAGGTNEMAIEPGATYRLSVRAAGRPPVTGTTTVPRVVRRHDYEIRYNRDRDTVLLAWPATPGAAQYALWVDAEDLTPSRTFTDRTWVTIDASKRVSIFGTSQEYLIAGERQRVLIAAVDATYYDYYRTETNPLTGVGLLSNIEGGTGLFGSSATIQIVTVRTVAAQNDAIEGLYERIDTTSSSAPRWIDLYVSDERTGYKSVRGWSGTDSTVREGTVRGYFFTDNPDALTFELPTIPYASGTLYGRDSLAFRIGGGSQAERITYLKRRVIR